MQLGMYVFSALFSVIGLALGEVSGYFYPECWTPWPLLFALSLWCVEAIMISLFCVSEGTPTLASLLGKNFMHKFVISKIVKVLVTLAFIITGIIVLSKTGRERTIVFAITSGIIYLVNLALVTLSVTHFIDKAKGENK